MAGMAEHSEASEWSSTSAGKRTPKVNKTAEAIEVMARALEIGEWERSMTHETLLPYLREETDEFADSVQRWAEDGPNTVREADLKKELSDILLQVLFHAELARRRGAFDFEDVAGAFVNKMRSRAPYLFDGTDHVVSIEEQERLWKEGKAREK